jgi:hypothetical protein
VELLQRYSHFTAVPKFTCEIRTSLSNLTELFPQLSISHATANPSLVTDASLESQTQNIPAAYLNRPKSVRSLNNICKVIDVIEPHHVRRCDTPLDYRSIFWISYGFSVVRWRKVILFFQPNLEHDITVVENHYHVILCEILEEIDTKRFYTKEQRLSSAIVLNIIYEVVCSLKISHTVNHTTITGYLEALKDRVSHLYCDLLPDKSSFEEHEREEYTFRAKLLASFTGTSMLYPPGWRRFETYLSQKDVLRLQKHVSTPKLEHLVPRLPQFTGLSKSFYPDLELYIPAKFLTIFGFDADSFCREESEYWSLYGTENILSNMFNTHRAMRPIISHILILAPCALSIAMRRLLQFLDVEKIQTGRRVAVQAIVALSVRLCQRFLTERLDEKYDIAWLDPPQSNLCSLMYAWAEENGDLLLPSR